MDYVFIIINFGIAMASFGVAWFFHPLILGDSLDGIIRTMRKRKEGYLDKIINLVFAIVLFFITWFIFSFLQIDEQINLVIAMISFGVAWFFYPVFHMDYFDRMVQEIICNQGEGEN